MHAANGFALSLIAAVLVLGAATEPCVAQTIPDNVSQVSPAPSPSASAAPSSEAVSAPTPVPEGPLFDLGTNIYTIDRDATLFYYFQGNNDGSAKVKQEFRYDQNIFKPNDQLQIRIPIITRYPLIGNPYSGLGNIELGYSNSSKSTTYDHALEARIAFNTESNGVESQDTQLKLFYTPKWKWDGGSVSYMNEFDQTIIHPPGSSWSSYYEGKLTLPEYPIAKGIKLSAIYNYRLLLDTNTAVRSAAGAVIAGSMNDFALSIYDTWGVFGSKLWRFKFEANATVRL